jgi:hypothetical protein
MYELIKKLVGYQKRKNNCRRSFLEKEKKNRAVEEGPF